MIYSDLDHSLFEFTELVNGEFSNPRNRGGKGKGEVWERQWAERGFNDASFVRVGRWRRGDVGDREKPVFIPWYIMDIDREELLEAFEDARSVLENIEMKDIPLDNILVAFSGRRGVHILLPSGMFGNPVYADSHVAKDMVRYVVEALAQEVRLDPMPTSPMTLIRVVGSKHNRTGYYKRAWRAKEFLSKAPHVLMDKPETFIPMAMPDPRLAPVEDYHEIMDAATIHSEEINRDRIHGKRTGQFKNKGIIERIKEGVDESQEFAPGYTGRSIATFLLARFLTNNMELSREDALTEMLAVNERHVPPMSPKKVEYILNWTLRNDPI